MERLNTNSTEIGYTGIQWLPLGDINTECPCERNCGTDCFFQLLQEVAKPRKGPSLLKSRSESVLSDYYHRASNIEIPLSDVGLPKRKPPTRSNSYTPNKKEFLTQSTEGRIESPGRSRHNNNNTLSATTTTPTTNNTPTPLSPNRHRKSTSFHFQTAEHQSPDVHDPLLQINDLAARLTVHQSGADHVFARVEEAEGDRVEIMSPLKLQKLKLQQRQLLENLARERSNSSHGRIHKRPKDMGIITEETD
jgi:hypothetical protein